MILLESKRALVRVNQAKVLRNHDPWHDTFLPESLSHVETPDKAVTTAPATSKGIEVYWLKQDGCWIRMHVKPRRALFTPTGIKGGPPEGTLKPLENLH